MPKFNLYVGGMGCRRCVREVTARLRDVPGVETVSADPVDCLVRIAGSMRLHDVLVVFAGTTYRPELIDDDSDDATGEDSGGTAVGKSEL